MRISDWSSDVCSSDLSQCFGQGAETGTARKVRLTCFRVLKRQHEVDPLLVAGGAWTSSRGSASSARSALVAIAYVQPFYMDRQARSPHRATRDRACGIAASSHANLISAQIMQGSGAGYMLNLHQDNGSDVSSRRAKRYFHSRRQKRA